MKISSIVFALALGAAVAQAVQTQAEYPGFCANTTDCASFGSNYACVSVDSSVPGLEKLSMCIPGDLVCSGQIAGACPTFSAWPKAYRVVQPVCVLVPVENCNKKFEVSTGSTEGDNTTTISSNATTNGTGTVECYSRNFTAGGISVTIDGIYQCVDYAKYLDKKYGYIDELTANTTTACAYNSTAKTLCSGQGTCAPKASFAQDYMCKCNTGYDGTANCSTVTSNKCSSLGQCGTSGNCTVVSGANTGTCTCAAGATGDQCTKCDSTSTSACNKHGTCGSDGVCTCSAGYSGTFCSDGTTTTPSSTTTTTSGVAAITNWPSFLATVVATAMTAGAVGAMVFA